MRNRLKRRLRESIRLRQELIEPGWDVVFIARRPIGNADYHQIDAACARLLRRAHLLKEPFNSDECSTDIIVRLRFERDARHLPGATVNHACLCIGNDPIL